MSLLSTLSMISWTAGFAGAAQTADDSRLGQLETKFFMHDYPKEVLASRLDRLEQMIFGETRSGTDAERLASLMSVTGKSEFGVKVPLTPPSPVNNIAEAERKKPVAASPGTGGNRTDYIPPAQTKYPSVTAMEQRLLGRDYAAEPIARRLERLETKAFGAPSKSTDFVDRVDRLKDRTRVDIATQAPPGADLSAEDEDQDRPPARSIARAPGRATTPRFGYGSVAPSYPPMAPPSANQSWYSGAAPSPAPSFGAPSYGAPRSGSYGVPPTAPQRSLRTYGSNYGYQPPAPIGNYPAGVAGYQPRTPQNPQNQQWPPYPPANPAPSARNPAGLVPTIATMEMRRFGALFPSDPLPIRLSRLELNVFPGQRPLFEQNMAYRVDRLARVALASGVQSWGALAGSYR